VPSAPVANVELLRHRRVRQHRCNPVSHSHDRRPDGQKQVQVKQPSGIIDGGWERKHDHVHVYIKDMDLAGRIFLGVTLGCAIWNGEASFTELDGSITPAQLDKVVECLTIARETKRSRPGYLSRRGRGG
jgi:hypothetical protein